MYQDLSLSYFFPTGISYYYKVDSSLLTCKVNAVQFIKSGESKFFFIHLRTFGIINRNTLFCIASTGIIIRNRKLAGGWIRINI